MTKNEIEELGWKFHRKKSDLFPYKDGIFVLLAVYIKGNFQLFIFNNDKIVIAKSLPGHWAIIFNGVVLSQKSLAILMNQLGIE